MQKGFRSYVRHVESVRRAQADKQVVDWIERRNALLRTHGGAWYPLAFLNQEGNQSQLFPQCHFGLSLANQHQDLWPQNHHPSFSGKWQNQVVQQKRAPHLWVPTWLVPRAHHQKPDASLLRRQPRCLRPKLEGNRASRYSQQDFIRLGEQQRRDYFQHFDVRQVSASSGRARLRLLFLHGKAWWLEWACLYILGRGYRSGEAVCPCFGYWPQNFAGTAAQYPGLYALPFWLFPLVLLLQKHKSQKLKEQHRNAEVRILSWKSIAKDVVNNLSPQSV